MKYYTCEVSPSLANLQLQTMQGDLEHTERFRVLNVDACEIGSAQESAEILDDAKHNANCWNVVMCEVADNLGHDRICVPVDYLRNPSLMLDPRNSESILVCSISHFYLLEQKFAE